MKPARHPRSGATAPWNPPSVIAAMLSASGDHVVIGLGDGSVVSRTWRELHISTRPPIVFAGADDVGGGIEFVREDGTIEDCSVEYLLAPPTSDARSKPNASAMARRVAKRIRILRQDRGLTQREVASRLDIAASNYARLEGGRHLPSVATLVELARCFGVPLSALTTR